jgi:phage terminase large subunit-like protein
VLLDGFRRIADSITNDFESLARPDQKPPPGEWSIWLILAGRGWGKSFTGAQWVRSLAEAGTVERIALVGPTAADVRDVMIEGQSGLLAIAPSSFRPIYEPSKRRCIYPNNVVATMYSSEEPERLRGPQHGAAWLDELGAWRNVQETYDQLQFGLRLGKRPRQCISTTPKPIKLLKELVKRASEGTDVVLTRGSTYDNRANLAESFLSTIVKRYEGSRIGRQELNAELLSDNPGALFSLDNIDAARLPPSSHWQEYKRVVVAIDPSVSSSDASDECGIIAAAIDFEGNGYVLEDGSARMSPGDWARRAVHLYRKWQADRIVAEVNNGGDMVGATVRSIDPNVSFKAVHASRGKVIRAEPVSNLYQQGRIHHMGTFPELEDQMVSWDPSSSDSPDRLDALVLAFSELMITPARGQLVFG